MFAGGIPFIKNYPPNVYHGHNQNWSIAQDQRGRIYVANNSQLMVFNGNNWDGYDFLKNTKVFSVDISKNGRIYIGGERNFGFVRPSQKGKLVYTSLSDEVEKKNQTYGSIWSIIQHKKEVIFFSNNCIFSYENNRITEVFPPNENQFHKIFKVNDKVLVRVINEGIYEYANQKLNFIKGTEIFSNIKVDFIFDEGNYYLIGTRDEGLFFYDKISSTVTESKNPSNNILKQSSVYHATKLHDNKIAIATRLNGLFFINKKGDIMEHVDKRSGLINDNAWFVFEDKDQNLWIATDKGISIVYYSLPFRKYDETTFLNGNINSTLLLNDVIYSGTTQGLYKIDQLGKIYQLLNVPIHHLLLFKNKGSFECLAASTTGVYGISKDKKPNAIITNMQSDVFYLYQSKLRPKLLFTCLNGMTLIYEKNKSEFKLLTKINHASICESIVEDNSGNIILGLKNEGLLSYPLDELITRVNDCKYSSIKFPDHIKNENSNFCLVRVKNKILVGTNNGLYMIKGKQLVKFPVINLEQNQMKRNVYRLYTDLNDQVWMSSNYAESYDLGVINLNNESKFTYSNQAFKSLKYTQINSVFSIPSRKSFISTNDGLIEYENQKFNTRASLFNSLIYYVKTEKGDTLFYGNHWNTASNDTFVNNTQSMNERYELNYSNNSFQFFYSTTCYTNQDELMFKTKLVGYDDEFSDWTYENKRFYTKVPNGDYQFIVYAKDIYGNVTEQEKFTLTIQTPWYKTYYAIVVYGILFFLIIKLIIQLNTFRLKQKNEQLEWVVKERTQEIEIQKNEIEKSNELLEQKNKDIQHKQNEITESIEYSKHIQESILPDKKLISETLPNSFILYKPKDIVSGDFYAYYLKKDRYIIAAVDCTGHGVPGALMSMLGSNILNQIINERNITKPSEILYQLNLGVTDGLKQNQNDGMDGMDIALIAIHKSSTGDTIRFEYAGANRPLYFIQDEKLTEIKATKQAIGGTQKNEERYYENHLIELRKNDCIYLTTDGYADQFGGIKNKKLTTTKFKEILIAVHQKEMSIQESELNNFIESWRGDNEQIDDICVIGLKL
jgi:serine phosphatase RsbU (regulator of sigma subunit)/ligand-binding sensor domain-containing protein